VKKPESRRAISHDFDALAETEALLRKYPHVTDAERDRIGRFLRHGSPMDIGLLSSNPDVWTAAQNFRAENRGYFALGGGFYAGWVVALVSIGLGLLFIKDMGLN
jgi:hypothetical protein